MGNQNSCSQFQVYKTSSHSVECFQEAVIKQFQRDSTVLFVDLLAAYHPQLWMNCPAFFPMSFLFLSPL